MSLKENKLLRIFVIAIVGLIIVAVVAAIIYGIVKLVSKKEGFSNDSSGFNIKEEFVGTNEYADQFKYAESYVNSVMGL